MKAVVTCDIIKSRQYSNLDRDEINRLIKTSFNDCCDLVPEANADKLSFSIIQGDEFQFLINKPEYAYQFVVFYRLILSRSNIKFSFRSGIGIDDIVIQDENTYKMDGPAFHKSREGINEFELKINKSRLTIIKYGKVQIDNELNMICIYQDLLESKWSAKNRSSILAKIKYQTLSEAALHENVTYQAIQKNLKAAFWEIFFDGIEYIRDRLNTTLTG
ncbi:MAG: hypothetical protein ISS80_01195 [Candidatus Cloacimonetes bacterium]|nr:hypothetical protein [Candidatus Cloacimonadota bacterium]MBL7148665.1 hypothetical protein [Candidatus Cloacimonadota bacterium]